jgi:hypothetical protein
MEKIKNHTRLSIILKATDRAGVRAEIFQHWISEKPGTPTVTNTYRYDVEKLSDGSQIYLTRPTRLNKGADFRIFCERFKKYKNGNDRPPSHKDLASEVTELIADSPSHKNELLTAIRRIWECEPSVSVLAGLKLFAGNTKAERVILLAKWFFIEQDVTYWIESGRNMLHTFFEDQFGKLP